jgi:hypothetical protein
MAKAKPKKVAKAKKPVKAKKEAKKAPKKAAKAKPVKQAKPAKKVKQEKPVKKEEKKVETKVKSNEKALGEVSNYFEHVQAAAIKLEAPLKVGDTIHIKGGDVDFEQKIDSMQINRVSITEAKVGDEVGIKVAQHVRKGYKVYKK